METSAEESPIDFSKFQLEQVIDDSAYSKAITIKGKYHGQTAVIRLEKTAFDEKSVTHALASEQLEAKRNLNNDIYSRYLMRAPSSTGVNDLKVIVVSPANDTVLAKYSRAQTVLHTETAAEYFAVVEKFINNMLTDKKDYNQWVYNILEGKTETEHILYNDKDPDSGFMLLPSLKSSGDERDIHILAICHRRDIRSLRDLTSEHLQLLENIRAHGTRIIKEKYVENRGQLRAYIHYHPTFYHFHVHFQLVDASEYKSSDRDNLLTTVISNISLMPHYYRECILTYPLSTASALNAVLNNSGDKT